MRLSSEQKAYLVSLKNGIGYQSDLSAKLAELGLLDVGKSRFAAWAKLTVKGREIASKIKVNPGASDPKECSPHSGDVRPKRRASNMVSGAQVPASKPPGISTESCPGSGQQRRKRGSGIESCPVVVSPATPLNKATTKRVLKRIQKGNKYTYYPANVDLGVLVETSAKAYSSRAVGAPDQDDKVLPRSSKRV